MLGAAQPNLGTKHQPCLIKQVPQQHQPGDTSHQSPSSFLPLSLHAKPRPTCCQTQSPNCYTSAKNLIMPKHHITKNSAPQFVTNTTQSTQPICHIAFHTILRTPSSPNIVLFEATQGQSQTISSIPFYQLELFTTQSPRNGGERENEKEIEDVNWERLWLRRKIILFLKKNIYVGIS